MADYQINPVTIDLNKVYTDAMGSPEITTLQKELDAKKQAVVQATTNINDNPWYSEANRVGRISKLNTTANQELGLLTEQLSQKKADAQVKINIAQQQYNLENAQYQANLTKLNALLTSGALAKASKSEIAQIAQATGLTTDMVKNMIAEIKKPTVKPEVITQTDNNGYVTVSVIDTNSGKLISKQSLGQVGKSDVAKTTATASSTKAKADQVVKDAQEKQKQIQFESQISRGLKDLQSGVTWGVVWNRIKNLFPDVPNSLIDNMLGTEWKQTGYYQNVYKKNK